MPQKEERLCNWIGRKIELDLCGATYQGVVIRVDQVIFPERQTILVANMLVNGTTVAMRFTPERCRQL